MMSSHARSAERADFVSLTNTLMRIATVGLTARLRRVVARQLPALHISAWSLERKAPQQRVAGAPFGTIYLVARDQRGDAALLERVRALSKRTPPWTIALVYTRRPPSPEVLLSLGQLGVVEMACTARDADPRVGLVALVQTISVRAESDYLMHLISPRLEVEAQRIVSVSLALAQEPCSTTRLATVCGLGKRTLSRRCHSSGLRSPRWVIGWTRALVAAYRIGEHQILPETAARQLGYRSVEAMYAELHGHGFEPPFAITDDTSFGTTLAESLQIVWPKSGGPLRSW